VHLGIGGVAPSDMAVLMGLNQNGQSLNLSHGLQQLGVTSPEALDRHVHQSRAKLTFAQTFPTGTHAMWLYYWLASQGIHPLQDVDSVVVPPPQMVAHLQAGRIDGFCVGEPWAAAPCSRIWASPWRPARASGPIIRKKSSAAPARSSSNTPTAPGRW
jgi:nitrate/nitrite transport system substrate-binding protein